MPLHSDQVQLSIAVGQQEMNAIQNAALTNAAVSGSSTVAAMESTVLAQPLHADQQPTQYMCNTGLTVGNYLGDVPSDPSSTSPATAAGLVARTQLNTQLRPATGPSILD